MFISFIIIIIIIMLFICITITVFSFIIISSITIIVIIMISSSSSSTCSIANWAQALGYRDIQTYCVAPIVDAGSAQLRRPPPPPRSTAAMAGYIYIYRERYIEREREL